MNPYRHINPRPTTGRTIGLAGLLAITAVLLGACATAPPPIEQMAVSNAALKHAASADAGALAPAEMSLARDKMARAEQAVTAKEYERALVLAQQAQLDAQLAEAKAEAAKSRKAADALLESSRVLREEMSRQSPTTAPRN